MEQLSGIFDQKDICEIAIPLSIFSKRSKKAVSLFNSVHAKENNDHCLDYEDTFRVKDLEVAEKIKRQQMLTTPTKFKASSKNTEIN